MENPYAPPKAAVDDADDAAKSRGERPRQVVWVIQIAVVLYVLGIIVMFVTWDYLSKYQSLTSAVIGQAFTLALTGWIYYKIYQGRNWARILWLVLDIVGWAMMPYAAKLIPEPYPLITKLQMALGFVASMYQIWLMFFSPGKYWFAKEPGERVRAGKYVKRK